MFEFVEGLTTGCLSVTSLVMCEDSIPGRFPLDSEIFSSGVVSETLH